MYGYQSHNPPTGYVLKLIPSLILIILRVLGVWNYPILKHANLTFLKLHILLRPVSRAEKFRLGGGKYNGIRVLQVLNLNEHEDPFAGICNFPCYNSKLLKVVSCVNIFCGDAFKKSQHFVNVQSGYMSEIVSSKMPYANLNLCFFNCTTIFIP
jgi:hypothetical protein